MSDPVYIGFDTETWLIAPGMLAPPLVVASICPKVENGAYLLLRDDALDFFAKMLQRPDVHLVIHNAAFDLAVMCQNWWWKYQDARMLRLVFDALRAGRIHCTRLRDKMLHNAAVGLTDDNGPAIGFHLADLVKRRLHLDISADKAGPDVWRLRYRELDGVPLSEWPIEAKTYAQDDAVYHLRVFESQEEERAGCSPDPLADEPGQMRADFCLHLMGMYGVRTDEVAIDALEAELHAVVDVAMAHLQKAGIYKGATKRNKETGLVEVTWSKNLTYVRELVSAALGEAAPRSEPSTTFPDGQVKTDEDTLLATGHPDLKVLAEVGTDNTTLAKWVPALRGLIKKGNTKTYEQKGLRIPGGWVISPSWNALVASGRTSCERPAFQQPARKGGVRPCVVPRPGFVFASVDYGFIEMVCWAQVCFDLFGFSDLRDAINADMDPHLLLASDLHKVSYEQALADKKAGAPWVKPKRQISKIGNFGFMGGLGAAKFLSYAKSNGYEGELTLDDSEHLKQTWRNRWSESYRYFRYMSQLSDAAMGPFQVVLERTGFVRGGCDFKSGCNTLFQGLAARGAKEAMFRITEECYLDESSELYGSRPVLFLHDEFILEVPEERLAAHNATLRLQELMVEGMRKFTPDVKVKAEPTLMRRWYKEAEPVWGADGILDVWEPKA